MPEIPKLDNLKDKALSKVPKKTNIFGEISGVNLTESIKLNTNPLQISGLFIGEKYVGVPSTSPLYSNFGGWNAFQNFLTSKGAVKDPTNNSEENKKLADELIAEFNAGEYVIKFPFNKITDKHIIFAQTYHKINDPKVQIDGWVGSQTSQLRYPTETWYYEWDTKEQQRTKNKNTPDGNKNLPIIKKDAYIPVIWGNKRFVIKVEDQVENYYKTGGINNNEMRSKYILYTEDKFPDIKFAFSSGLPPKEWYTVGQSTEPNKSASQLNVITAQTNKIKENFKTQTKVVSNILSKGKKVAAAAKSAATSAASSAAAKVNSTI